MQLVNDPSYLLAYLELYLHTIQSNNFITCGNITLPLYGRESFKHPYMKKLDRENQVVLLNDSKPCL